MTTPPASPSKIGRYRIERELGRGAMGIVYEAEDTALGRKVALKTFATMNEMAPNEREAFEQRFLNEARIAATIEDRNVVAVYDVGRDSETGLLFMALEYVRGETLAETLGSGAMPWQDAARIIAKVARALHTAHAQQIVHRDIKPANVMMTSSGEPKVMDFGIARAASSHLTLAGQVFGTPSYMSPEQAAGELVDARSDIFSLGAVFYELVTDARAFEGPTVSSTLTKILLDEPRPASQRSNAPEAVDAIIKRALRKAREERYETAAQLAADLENLLDGKPIVGDSTTASPRAPTDASGRSREPMPETILLSGRGRQGAPSLSSWSRKLPLLAGTVATLVLAAVVWRVYPQPTVGVDRDVEAWAKAARQATAAGDAAAALAALELVTSRDPKSALAAQLSKDVNTSFATSAIAAQAEMAQARALAEAEAGTHEDPAFAEAETIAASGAERLHAGQFAAATRTFIEASAAYDRARRTLLGLAIDDAPSANVPAEAEQVSAPTEAPGSAPSPRGSALSANAPPPPEHAPALSERLRVFATGRTEISGTSSPGFAGDLEFEVSPNPLRLGASFRVQIFLKNTGAIRGRLRTLAVSITRNGTVSTQTARILKDTVKEGDRALIAEIPARDSGQRLVSADIETWTMNVEAVLDNGAKARSSLTMTVAPE